MKNILCIFTLLLCAGSLRAQLTQQQLTALYDSLTHPILDDNALCDIANVTVHRGGQTMTFKSGTIRFFAPVHGRIIGAVFLGTGFYVVAPPTEVEKTEFERQTSNKLDTTGRYSYEFQRAVLWFADSIDQELRAQCHFRSGGVQRPERDAVKRSLQFATDVSNWNGIFRVVQELLEAHPKSYVLAHMILDRDGNDMFLRYDLRRFEEVVIEQTASGYSGGFSYALSPICAFHVPEEYGSSSEFDLSQEDRRPVNITDTKVDVTLEQREKMIMSSTIGFTAFGEPPAGLVFDLFPYFKIKSIKNSSNEPIPYIRTDKAWEMFVLLPKPDSAGYHITFEYDGDFKLFGYIEDIFPPSPWYPVLDFNSRINFDLTYRIPKELTVVSAGWRVSEQLENDTRIVHYKTKNPTLLVSFSMGEFHSDSLRQYPGEPTSKGYYFGKGDAQVGLHDISSSLHLFTNLFGKIDYDELNAVDGPFGNGQAFQQLVHLPWTQEKENVKRGTFAVTLGRAHEVSHAWWGHAVGWRSYHDQWLSEGFAHYSALLHTLFVLRQDEPFFDKLREWKSEITGARKYAFGSGPAAGSIWLGYRSASVKTREDPTLLIYKKGAWVLHMLRMLMMDLQTSKEDAFKAMMKDYYASFNGMDPGTIDFQHTVEKYLRMDMSWFFNEWVYRIEIPTYKVHHTFTKNEAGKWVAAINVKESGVPASFKMFVPIEIKLKDGNSALTRLFIDAASKDFSYELDAEPEAVIFNKFESVLCTVEE